MATDINMNDHLAYEPCVMENIVDPSSPQDSGDFVSHNNMKKNHIGGNNSDMMQDMPHSKVNNSTDMKKSPSTRTPHAFASLIILDVYTLKAPCGAVEVAQLTWSLYDVEQNHALEEGFVLVRPDSVETHAEAAQKIGVTVEALNASGSLSDGIEQLDSVIFRRCQESRKAVILCTFFKQKLSRELRGAAKNKDVTLFAHYNQFVDLKHLLRENFKLRGDSLGSLKAAANALNLSGVEGREDVGLNACRLMCDLITLLLMKRNLIFKKEHATQIDDSEIDAAAMGPMAGTRVKLRGLPWDITEDAISQFFRPVCNVEECDIVICVGLDKRVTGEAYVNLSSVMVRDFAVRTLHGQRIKTRWIEVFKASDEDFEKAEQRRCAVLQSEHADARDADVKSLGLTVLKLRGLPWTCTEREILAFFKDGGFNVRQEDVVLALAADGRMSGMAYVELADSQQADEAKLKLHRRYLGKRFVEVYPATREEMFRARRPARGGGGGAGGGGDMAGAMRSRGRFGGAGLSAANTGPYGGGFGGTSYGPPPGSVYGTTPPPSAASASGYGNSAYSGNGGYLGGGGAPPLYNGGGGGGEFATAPNYAPPTYGASPPPTLTPAGGGAGAGASSSPATTVVGTAPDGSSWNHSVLRLRGMPFTANEQHIVHFFQGFHMAAILPSTIPIDGRPSGEAYVQFVDASEAWRAYQNKNGCHMDKRYIELFPASKQEMNFAAQGGDPRVFRERNRPAF